MSPRSTATVEGRFAMCGVGGVGGSTAAMTAVNGASGGGSTVQQAPPTKDMTQVAGASGGGALAGVDALKPVLEQLSQAIAAITALLAGTGVAGASGGGGDATQTPPGKDVPPSLKGEVAGESGAGQDHAGCDMSQGGKVDQGGHVGQDGEVGQGGEEGKGGKGEKGGKGGHAEGKPGERVGHQRRRGHGHDGMVGGATGPGQGKGKDALPTDVAGDSGPGKGGKSGVGGATGPGQVAIPTQLAPGQMLPLLTAPVKFTGPGKEFPIQKNAAGDWGVVQNKGTESALFYPFQKSHPFVQQLDSLDSADIAQLSPEQVQQVVQQAAQHGVVIGP